VADQPTKAMTLREAVEIVALGRLKYGEKVYWDAPKYTTPSGRKEAEARGFADWDRARAIVDAAVLFVEANERECSNECRSDDFMLGQDEERARKKLRALERGEDTRP
jgi:hypothetical protein